MALETGLVLVRFSTCSLGAGQPLIERLHSGRWKKAGHRDNHNWVPERNTKETEAPEAPEPSERLARRRWRGDFGGRMAMVGDWPSVYETSDADSTDLHTSSC